MLADQSVAVHRIIMHVKCMRMLFSKGLLYSVSCPSWFSCPICLASRATESAAPLHKSPAPPLCQIAELPAASSSQLYADGGGSNRYASDLKAKHHYHRNLKA